ncbi:MAG: hypothetical protein EZS28_014325 [Streblomastix strix]|uniref:Uncharacterized protein n=1 Tax=Streblomastix strix TaxID=222440 RepID=A0A5J4W5V8_9EUKA|nr:MAG: hypothetical protein EZS28_014325 [Streblomastix strix]
MKMPLTKVFLFNFICLLIKCLILGVRDGDQLKLLEKKYVEKLVGQLEYDYLKYQKELATQVAVEEDIFHIQQQNKHILPNGIEQYIESGAEFDFEIECRENISLNAHEKIDHIYQKMIELGKTMIETDPEPSPDQIEKERSDAYFRKWTKQQEFYYKNMQLADYDQDFDDEEQEGEILVAQKREITQEAFDLICQEYLKQATVDSINIVTSNANKYSVEHQRAKLLIYRTGALNPHIFMKHFLNENYLPLRIFQQQQELIVERFKDDMSAVNKLLRMYYLQLCEKIRNTACQQALIQSLKNKLRTSQSPPNSQLNQKQTRSSKSPPFTPTKISTPKANINPPAPPPLSYQSSTNTPQRRISSSPSQSQSPYSSPSNYSSPSSLNQWDEIDINTLQSEFIGIMKNYPIYLIPFISCNCQRYLNLFCSSNTRIIEFFKNWPCDAEGALRFCNIMQSIIRMFGDKVFTPQLKQINKSPSPDQISIDEYEMTFKEEPGLVLHFQISSNISTQSLKDDFIAQVNKAKPQKENQSNTYLDLLQQSLLGSDEQNMNFGNLYSDYGDQELSDQDTSNEHLINKLVDLLGMLQGQFPTSQQPKPRRTRPQTTVITEINENDEDEDELKKDAKIKDKR